MMYLRSFSCGVLAVSLVLAEVGCASKKPVPVEGLVTLDGKPVARAAVTFVPERGGRPAVGLTGSDGIFELTTFSSGDGVPPGDYKVTVTKTSDSDDPLSEQLSDPAKAKELYLKLTLHREKRASSKPKGVIPAVYGNAQSSPLRCSVPTEGTVHLKLKSAGGS